MGVMPPWFIDKNVGIQDYKDDISLSEKEIATIAAWVDAGAPRGNPADMPPPRVFTAAERMGDRRARPDRRHPARHDEGQRAGLVGRAAAQCRPG